MIFKIQMVGKSRVKAESKDALLPFSFYNNRQLAVA